LKAALRKRGKPKVGPPGRKKKKSSSGGAGPLNSQKFGSAGTNSSHREAHPTLDLFLFSSSPSSILPFLHPSPEIDFSVHIQDG
jgi:hypothetical protein